MGYAEESTVAYPTPSRGEGAVIMAAKRCNEAVSGVGEALELLDRVLRPVVSQAEMTTAPDDRPHDIRPAPSSELGIDLDGLAARLTTIARAMRELARRVEL